MDPQIPSTSILNDDDQCTASIIRTVDGETNQQQDDTEDGIITMTKSSSDSANDIFTASQASLSRPGHSNGGSSQNMLNVDDQETPNFEINDRTSQVLKKECK